MRMTKVPQKKTGGDVVKSDRTTSATALTAKIPQLEVEGHCFDPSSSSGKVNERGKSEGKP